MAPAQLRLQVNGEPRSVDDGTTVADLLRRLDLPSDGVAVEVNRTILPRRVHSETRASDGSRGS